MTVKLNLTIDEKIVERSKIYAARKNTSVSKMVERFLEDVTQKNELKKPKLSFAEKYGGTAKFPIPDIDAARDEYLKEKYGY